MTVKEVTSLEAWKILNSEEKAYLIDVRTTAEHTFVGVPFIPNKKVVILVPWVEYPTMQINENFSEDLEAAIGNDKTTTLLMLCRTGCRSHDAAVALAEQRYTNVYNICDGFEGRPDTNSHRGTIEGWKASNLPWRQG